MIEYRVIEKSKLKEIENLRKEVFGFDSNNDSYYYRELLDSKMIAIGAFLDDILIAGAYISNSLNSLYIEQLFVSVDYQNKGIGKNLVTYIHKSKKIFEDYFKTKFEYSKLEPNSKKIVDYYEKLGFTQSNDFQESMKKRI